METADFADIIKRRKTHFVLWGLKSPTTYTPQLVIGEFLAGNPPTLTNQKKYLLKLVAGFPEGNSSPTANSDLAALIVACHKNKIRFFVDMVMAFCKQGSFQCLNFDDFHINQPENNQNDPDALTSTRSYGRKEVRNGFGSSLFRYAKKVNDAYDPISGTKKDLFPARQYMMTYLVRWMLDFHIDGIRLDSIENVFNWDFMRDFKDFARTLWNQRWNSQGLSTLSSEANSRFLVVGEELTVPKEIVRQQVLDGLWNEDFKKYIRAAIIGQNAANEPSFEWTVRKAIDSREMGFTDASQAIIYLTSHDVEGFRNERLYNFLGTIYEKKQRIQLAFVCLLTAVGIPMILAGDEFADEHDRFDRDGNVSQSGGKQVDPVNFSRLEGSNNQWRRDLVKYVSRLIKFRTQADALAVNDTKFIHVDFSEGKRVFVWQRGREGIDDPVIVVANFSDFGTDTRNPGAEYRISNRPATPPGREWIEITQQRTVTPNFVGREPIYPWEAKVYTLK